MARGLLKVLVATALGTVSFLFSMAFIAVPAASASTVGGLHVTVSPPTAGATNVTYTFTFVATHGINASPSSGYAITIQAPNGTDFRGTRVDYVDNSEPGDSQSNADWQTSSGTPSLDGIEDVSAGSGDSITMTIGGVTNPSAPAGETLTMTTDTDTGSATASYSIISGTVGHLAVQVDPSANAIPDATYTFTFVATHGINASPSSGYAITIQAPNGTDFRGTTVDYVDNSQPGNSQSNADWQTSSGTPSLDGIEDISAGSGDSITMTIGGVTNPSTANSAYTLTLATDNDPTVVRSPAYAILPQGYWEVASDGGIFSYGNAQFHGSTGSLHLNQPIVGMAKDPSTGGYWLVAADGGIFSFNAPFYGSMGGKHLNRPIVGMTDDPATGGYWFVASDGGIFSFNAPFYGSTGSLRLNKPIVGMATTPDGKGYWLVASDGGIFSFGDAHFFGSTGSIHLNEPIIGMAADDATGGYWMVASDGGVFSFNAPFFGSTGGQSISAAIVAVSSDGLGLGYRFVGSDGKIYAFGNEANLGDPSSSPLNQPVVGMAPTT